jgi:hypothetical protein
LLAALVLAWAGRARAQQHVGFDAASSGSGDGRHLSFDHTVGTGNDRYLVVSVAVDPPTGVRVVAISYGGQVLSAIGSRSGVGCRAELWGLTAPDSGAHTVSIELDGDPQSVVAGAASLTGVDQASPRGRFASHTGTNDSPVSLETSVAIAGGDYTVDVVCGSGGAAPDTKAGAGQTERWGRAQGTLGAAGSTQTNASAGRANMAWTLKGAGSIDWTIATAALKPAPVAASGPDAGSDAGPDVAPMLDAAPDLADSFTDAAAEALPPDGAADLVPADAAAEVEAIDVATPAEDAGETHDVELRVGCACRTGGPGEGGGWILALVLAALSVRRACSAPRPARPRSIRRRWRPRRSG